MGKMMSLNTMKQWPRGQSQKQTLADVLKNFANFTGKYQVGISF